MTPVIPLKKRVERGAGAIALRLIVGPLRAMPLPLARKCGRGLGMALYYLLGRYRRVAIKNLTLVYGQEKSRAEIVGMAREVFQNFGETAVEFVKLPQLSREQTEALAVVEGHEHLAAAMEQKRGILMISGHFGNWEFMSRYVTLLGYTLNVVVRDARDPVATKLLADTREGLRRERAVSRQFRSDDLLAAEKKIKWSACCPIRTPPTCSFRFSVFRRER